ncbi:hypothetical protein H0H87_005828 [Tephrocybe sp. NHM501043]|nr:hypothetical protein H0H87_005828 [Tephrocybe sp. NHM501043]
MARTPLPQRRPRYGVSPAVMMSVAKDLANILRQRGLHFAFCEDIATYAYGVTRWYPRSIKIMILLGSLNIEELSRSIASSSNLRFRYDGSPGVLSHRASSKPNDSNAPSASFRVQLVPTNRHPLHSSNYVVDDIPLVPFTFVLLEQLAEWDKSAADDETSEGKQKVVMSMLRYFRSNLSKPYCKPIRSFDPILHADSQVKVARFYDVQASYLAEWRKMGFLSTDWNPSSNIDNEGLDFVHGDDSQYADPSVLADSLVNSLAVSSPSPTLTATLNPLIESSSSEVHQPQSKSLFVKCPPRLLELLYDWDNDPPKKEESSREIQTFLISIRMGRQTLVTGPRPALDALVHAQVHRYLTENKAFFLQWQKMGFFESYTSKDDVPPAPPKSDRGYFLPPKRVVHSGPLAKGNAGEGSLAGKVGKTSRKTSRQLAFGEVRTLAAEATVAALRDLGYACAIFGSMACRLYGSSRLPNDVDVLVLGPGADQTQESIKDMLVAHSPDRFFLQSARDPAAQYRVLHYRPSSDPASSQKDIIKIDILLPGVMNLPPLAPSSVVMRSGLPVVPYPVLLLQKLQAWDDHRLSEEERYRKKVPIDAKDLLWLLTSSDVELVPADAKNAWSDRSLFSEAFEKLSRERIKALCAAIPTFREKWAKLGLEES